jgi:hypothetical protein
VSGWAWLWLGWIGYFAVVEGVALYKSGKAKGRGSVDPRDTLSEHVWYWFGINTTPGVLENVRRANWWARVRRLALGAFLLWLAIHFLTGGTYF